MDFNHFNSWTLEFYSFDCFANPLFTQSLYYSFDSFKASTINGVPLPIFHQDDLYPVFLQHYVRHLKLLINRIPLPDSVVSLNVHGVNLNEYHLHKEDLLSQLSRLDV